MNGVMVPDATALGQTVDALRTAERAGDDVSLTWTRNIHGIMQLRLHEGDPETALELVANAREQAVRQGDLLTGTIADIQMAEFEAYNGDVGAAIEMSRAAVEHLFDCGAVVFRGPASTVLVESLLRRGTEDDLREAQTVVDRLTACPIDAGFVLYGVALLRLRALLARANGDEAGYCDYRDRYRDMSTWLDLEGHIAWAREMF
jgi:adenylate cyclase